MVPESEPRQRRGSMIDEHMAEPFMREGREGRRGSDGSDIDPMPMEKRDRRMYEPPYTATASQAPMLTYFTGAKNGTHRRFPPQGSRELKARYVPPRSNLTLSPFFI